jgi:hypothetical protein
VRGTAGREVLDIVGGFIFTVVQVVIISPIWFIAKWFGAPWTIVVERNGTQVCEVKVRGASAGNEGDALADAQRRSVTPPLNLEPSIRLTIGVSLSAVVAPVATVPTLVRR